MAEASILCSFLLMHYIGSTGPSRVILWFSIASIATENALVCRINDVEMSMWYSLLIADLKLLKQSMESPKLANGVLTWSVQWTVISS